LIVSRGVTGAQMSSSTVHIWRWDEESGQGYELVQGPGEPRPVFTGQFVSFEPPDPQSVCQSLMQPGYVVFEIPDPGSGLREVVRLRKDEVLRGGGR
jgi:hypothetical protein